MITIDEDLFIGKGAHKIVYGYPGDNKKCIKIVFEKNDRDLPKEFSFRNVLKRQGRECDLLPRYYGEVETDKGTGYVFEKIVDFDGQVSREVEAYVENPNLTQELLHQDILTVLKKLKCALITELPVLSTLHLYNICVQRLSESQYRFVIVDNIGLSVLIPLPYYFSYAAKIRLKSYWHKLLKELNGRLPNLYDKQFVAKLW